VTQYSSAAGVKEWLEATKGMTIKAFIDSKDFTLVRELDKESFTKEDFEKASKKVSRRIKK